MKNTFLRLSKLLLAGLFIFSPSNSVGQSSSGIIPADRRIDWNPGLPGDIPDYPVGANVRDFGAVGDGVQDDTPAFKSALNSVAEGRAIFIPAGTYLLTSPLKVGKGIVLRGEGYDKTVLRLNFSAGGSGISLEKWGNTGWVNITGGYSKGSRSITVSSAAAFRVGDYVELRQDNDPAVYSPGSLGSYDDASVGQLLKISDISNNTLTFNNELYYSYNSAMNPRIRSLELLEGAGVEKLTIERLNTGPWGSNISFNNTAYCWVREVWSQKTLTAHIFMSRAYHTEIRDSYFNDSHLHGSGGQGYGIRMEARSTDNLIENNIFERLRHSLLVQVGATGNVFGYNYSKDPFLEEGNDWLMADLVNHGHYPSMNLFEGNTVQFILIDNVWGTNGPNTFFRNRVEKAVSHYLNNTERFPFLEVKENNPRHNIIGNEVGIAGTSSQSPLGIDPSVANTLILHGNYVQQNGQIQWDPDISQRDLPDSYYLTAKPAWFGDLDWPALGGDISPNSRVIPAQQRYREGVYIPGPPTADNEPPAAPQNIRATP